MSRCAIYAFSIHGREWHTANHAGILAYIIIVTRLQNPSRKKAQTILLHTIRIGFVASHFYTIYVIFCNFLRVIRNLPATFKICGQNITQVSANFNLSYRVGRHSGARHEYCASPRYYSRIIILD